MAKYLGWPHNGEGEGGDARPHNPPLRLPSVIFGAIVSLIARPCHSVRVSVRPSIRVISVSPGTPAVPPAARGVRSRCGACEQDCP